MGHAVHVEVLRAELHDVEMEEMETAETEMKEMETAEISTKRPHFCVDALCRFRAIVSDRTEP